jgi:hypothetical protein
VVVCIFIVSLRGRASRREACEQGERPFRAFEHPSVRRESAPLRLWAAGRNLRIPTQEVPDLIDPDEKTLTDGDIETVVHGSAAPTDADPDTKDADDVDDTDTGDTDESDADDDATDEGGGDTDTTDAS